MDLNLYGRMIGKHRSLTDAYVSDTINHINEMFYTSPSIKNINGGELDCIVNHTKKENKLDLLFLPNTDVSKGSYYTIDEKVYLSLDCIPNPIYPKSFVTLCNNELKWKIEDQIYSYPCVVTNEMQDNSAQKNIILNQDELAVYIQANPQTMQIKLKDRFVLGKETYEVVIRDKLTNVYKGEGYLELALKFVNIADSDDLEEGIADNSSNSGWGNW